jgi:ribonuclease D
LDAFEPDQRVGDMAAEPAGLVASRSLAPDADLPGRRLALLVDTAARFAALLATLRGCCPHTLGLDTETANSSPDAPDRERPSLLQLAFRVPAGSVQVAVLDLFALRDVRALQPVLVRPTTVVFAHHYAYDERMLLRLGLRPRCVYDTCRAGRVLYDGAARLADLADRVLATPMDKTLQDSDWGRRPLSREQIAYAARDAADTLVIGELARELLPEVPEPLPALPPGDRAAYRHLLDWRAETAAALRRFPEDILPQRTLRAIALQRPDTPAALLGLPGVGATRLARYGAGILTALAEAELAALLAGTPVPTLTIVAATLLDDGLQVQLAAPPTTCPAALSPCLHAALRGVQPWRQLRTALAGLRLRGPIQLPRITAGQGRGSHLLPLFAAPVD